MLITEEYRKQNEQLHDNPEYGARNAGRWVKPVTDLCREYESFDVLDYGCGKGNLSRSLTKYPVKNYDPAMPEFATPPTPAEIVVCTDVMEHVEPECLAEVIDHLYKLTGRVLLVNIALRPARKTLPDGRNAHLNVQNLEYWINAFGALFNICQINGANGGEVTMVLEPVYQEQEAAA
jgi:2-polyprenyl-3-methyl-5-hydroxy-6-metoxy-1,4-benzoquinol methylase